MLLWTICHCLLLTSSCYLHLRATSASSLYSAAAQTDDVATVNPIDAAQTLFVSSPSDDVADAGEKAASERSTWMRARKIVGGKAARVEGNIGVALQAAVNVPGGFAVANQTEAGGVRHEKLDGRRRGAECKAASRYCRGGAGTSHGAARATGRSGITWRFMPLYGEPCCRIALAIDCLLNCRIWFFRSAPGRNPVTPRSWF